MLPSLGLFRVCPCPYYVVGLCERPHCCFRHCRSDVEAARRESVGIEAEEEDSLDPDSEQISKPAKVLETGGKNEQAAANWKQSEVITSKAKEEKTELKESENYTSNIMGQKRSMERDDKVEQGAKRSKLDVDQSSKLAVEEAKSVDSGKLSVNENGSGRVEQNHSEKEKPADEKLHKSKSKSSSSTKREKSKHKSGHRDDEHNVNSSSKHKHHKDSHRSRSSSHGSSHRSGSTSSSSHKSRNSHTGRDDKKHSSHSHKHKSSGSSSKHRKDSSSDKTSADELARVEPETSEAPVTSTTDNSSVVTVTIDDDDPVPDDFLYPSDEEDDPDQIALECFKMFQDYKNDDSGAESLKLETIPEPKLEEAETESSSFGKKRVAHVGAVKPLIDKTAPPKRKESAREQLIRRMQTVQESQPMTFVTSPSPPVSSSAPAVSPNKRRIAHVSNPAALVKPLIRSDSAPASMSDNKIESSSAKSNGIDSVTLSQTVPKGEKRVAHAPKPIERGPAGPAPKVVPDLRSKVPTVVRQKFLEQIYREFLQLCPDSASASCKAVEEEKALLAKCNTKQVYSCSAANLIAKLRKQYRESTADTTGSNITTGTKVISHSDILAGKAGGSVSWSIERKTSTVPVGNQLYQRLTDYLMSSTELIDNGYPRKCPTSFKGCKGTAIIKPREDCTYSRVLEESNRKTCDRCGISYLVDEEGFPIKKELCTYHSGRRFGRRTRTGNAESRYTCCDGELNSSGCCTASSHVFSGKTSEDLKNFICAALDPGDPATMGTHPWDIIGVDCEMVYTTRGSQLARATFVDVNGKILYDTLVKPSNPVLDYNTRFSGIDEEMLKNVKITIKEVHLKILANLKPNTIIVGHSLENDLIALKLIHGCVVDTSLVFPHKRGPPFKRALRNLTAECLGKIIQTGEGGHDSAEDARAALDLMLWKVKNDSGKVSKSSELS